ncbi:unnamed protein product [Chilo suppressalis]|uniref:Cathepsin propeptide inhibitor domain-containing protein n=1 Tax=Chilo suppressalis TaxID=168631 RepID=A0ABN8ASM2_CHISP|nr:hypothetical protein evm_004107 [Chilo suppressalis]CAH0397847.1 unnamed protein product [Chilo suppressalis]
MFLCSLLLAVTISVEINTEYYTKENATATFNFFKEKYHKKYSPADEKEAYENFLSNLNKVTVLNMNPKEKNIMYTLNKYADLDPSEIQEHFALNLSSYDAHEVYKGPIVRNRHILRNIIEPTPEGANLDSMELYDLDDAENLFREYTKAFGPVRTPQQCQWQLFGYI